MSAGTQALSGAQGAAQAPFQTPAAPVANFSPDQFQAFLGVRGLQGMNTPYYNYAANYTNQSASPITPAEINNYYNPMAGAVSAQLQNIFGQQQRNTTGQLTQAAGGVGADRIAVGQGELANQQGLAAGQTFAGLYNNALGAAEQDRQRQANAGYAMSGLGTATQNSALQGYQALLNSGALQQQLQQQQLMSPYNQELQRLAYPFQTNQYLAGIVGGVGPALGGTTNSNTVTTPPQPSIFSQIAGAGLAGAGLYGAYNGLSGGGGKGGVQGYNNLPTDYANNGSGIYTGPASQPGFQARGGAVRHAAAGGGFSDPFGEMGGRSIVPDVTLNPMPVNIPQAPQPQQSQSQSGMGLGDIAKIAATVLPLVLSDGGAVSPYKMYEGFAGGGRPKGYADGGETFDDRFGDMPPSIDMSDQGVVPGGSKFWRAAQGLQNEQTVNSIFPPQGNNTVPLAAPRPSLPPSVSPFQAPDDAGGGGGGDGALPPNAQPTGGRLPPLGGGPTGGLMPPMPAGQTPYPGALKRDAGQDFARSPWMALTSAGLGMMSGTSPYAGVNIGKGGLEGLKTLESQRKQGREEESINLHAQQLWQDAQKHLDAYRSPTAYQKGELALRKHQLDISEENNAYYPPVANVYGDGFIQLPKKAGLPPRYFKLDENGLPVETKGPSGVSPAPGATKPGEQPTKPPEEAKPSIWDAPKVASSIAPQDAQAMTAEPQAMLDTSTAATGATRQRDMARMYPDAKSQSQGRAQAEQERKKLTEVTASASTMDQRAKQIRRNLDVVTNWTNSLDPKLRSTPYLKTLFDPGADGDARQAAIVKYNTYARNSNLPQIPQEVVAAIVAMGKDSTLAGFKNVTAEGLSAREAQPIIRAAMGTVPGFNTPESASRLLAAGYEEAGQKAKDAQAFFEDFRKKNGGMSNGWLTAFNKQYPPSMYVARTVMRVLPPEAKAALPANVTALRGARDAVMEAEKSGDQQAIAAAIQKYNIGKTNFDRKFGNLSNYFMFGTM